MGRLFSPPIGHAVLICSYSMDATLDCRRFKPFRAPPTRPMYPCQVESRSCARRIPGVQPSNPCRISESFLVFIYYAPSLGPLYSCFPSTARHEQCTADWAVPGAPTAHDARAGSRRCSDCAAGGAIVHPLDSFGPVFLAFTIASVAATAAACFYSSASPDSRKEFCRAHWHG
jgi:hypothetical protein